MSTHRRGYNMGDKSCGLSQIEVVLNQASCYIHAALLLKGTDLYEPCLRRAANAVSELTAILDNEICVPFPQYTE